MSDVETINKIYILRSRFQPFTHYHYEAILRLLEEYREEFENNNSRLVLLVIRDYETLFQTHGRGISDDDKRLTEEEFRHIPVFNPLSISSIHFIIRTAIDEYSIKLADLKIKRFLAQVSIIPVPVKFPDLIKILAEPSEPIKEFKIRMGCTSDEPCLFLNWNVMDSIGYIPEKAHRVWYMPIFDSEDIDDLKDICKGINDGMLSQDETLMGHFEDPLLYPTDVKYTPIVGLFGAFSIYSHQLWQLKKIKKGDNTLTATEKKELIKENKQLEKILQETLPSKLWEYLITQMHINLDYLLSIENYPDFFGEENIETFTNLFNHHMKGPDDRSIESIKNRYSQDKICINSNMNFYKKLIKLEHAIKSEILRLSENLKISRNGAAQKNMQKAKDVLEYLSDKISKGERFAVHPSVFERINNMISLKSDEDFVRNEVDINLLHKQLMGMT